MRKVFTFLAIAALSCTLSTAQAAVVSIGGDVGDIALGTSGQLEVLIDTSSSDLVFNNGGLSLSVNSSQSGVVQFTGAEITNPSLFGGFSDRWSITSVVDVTADMVGDLFAGSANSPALNTAAAGNPIVDGGSVFLYATINYDVIGAGSTDLGVGISTRPDPLIQTGDDVSSQVSFVGSSIMVTDGGGMDPMAVPSLADMTPIDLSDAFRNNGGVSDNALSFTNSGGGTLEITDARIETGTEDPEGVFAAARDGLNVDLSINLSRAFEFPAGTAATATLIVETNGGNFSYPLSATIPEPATLSLVGLAMIGLIGLQRRS